MRFKKTDLLSVIILIILAPLIVTQPPNNPNYGNEPQKAVGNMGGIETLSADSGKVKESPGFWAVYPIAGLIVVAFFVLRQKK